MRERLSRGKTTRHIALCALAVVTAAWCLVAGQASAGSSIAQGFQVGGPGIVSGALVSLRTSSASTVELSSVQNRDRLLGVAAGKQALIEFANGSPLQVVTGGIAPALVSDINGLVKSGDHITSSPIVGVGMKATESAMVVGSAQGDMQIQNSETRTIKMLNGQTRTVHIGAVSMLVTPAFYQASGQSSFVPSAIEDFAASLTGHAVSPMRVLIAGLLIVLLFVAVAMLLYSSVRSSIVAIGRNPLSEAAVQKSLFQVGITVVGVLAFTVIIVYLILSA